jgi:hypothetical protein
VNIIVGISVAWKVEGQNQDILDFVFLGAGALPFLFMVPATISIVRHHNELFRKNAEVKTPLIASRTKKRLVYFLLRLVILLAFTCLLFAKWIAFSYIYVNIVDKGKKPGLIKPSIWYGAPFCFLDGFLLSVVLLSTPELRGLYKKRMNAKDMEAAHNLPVSRET